MQVIHRGQQYSVTFKDDLAFASILSQQQSTEAQLARLLSREGPTSSSVFWLSVSGTMGASHRETLQNAMSPRTQVRLGREAAKKQRTDNIAELRSQAQILGILLAGTAKTDSEIKAAISQLGTDPSTFEILKATYNTALQDKVSKTLDHVLRDPVHPAFIGRITLDFSDMYEFIKVRTREAEAKTPPIPAQSAAL